MDRARNSITGEEYSAPDISEQHLAQPEKDRDLWLTRFRIANPAQCLGCGNKASFCKRASNGNAAKFSAHHDLGCPFSSTKQKEAGEKAPEELEKVPSRDNDGSITVIMRRTMNPFEPDGSTGSESTAHPNAGNPSRRAYVLPQTGETSHNRRRTLGTLLAALLYSTNFPDDQHWVEVPERGQARETDYYRRADQATEQDRGRHMAYWGRILDVRKSQDGNTYINTARDCLALW